VKWLAGLLDRFLDRIAPLPDFTGPDWLTDEEADRDGWLADELLSTHLNSADTPTHSGLDTPARVSGNPAGSPDPRRWPTGTDTTVSAGGVTDEQRIQELLADYESFLRDLFRR
jgi:hypothetical protein